MKTNYWLVLGAMLATSAVAQNNTNTLPEMPAPVSSPAAEMAPAPVAVTNIPAATPVKHKRKRAATPAKSTFKEPTVTLVAGPAEVTVSNVNVRDQAGLRGEVVAHLFQGDAVTVLNQINLDRHKADEPAQWAKISYPTNAHVWVSAKYVDTNGIVLSKKLNLRAGPGENFSVVGVLERGTPVSSVSTKNGWMRIEAPTNAYAFVAAMYLKQEAGTPEATTTAPAETEPAPMPTPVPEAQPIVTEPTNPPAAEPPAPEAPPADTNVAPPTRIVSHEGVVRHVGSLITPTEFELYDPTTDKNIDFLYTTTTNLDLSRYVGMRIIVNGEEDLAARWADIPVLTVQRILVIDTNAVPQLIYRSPKAAGQQRH
jgi:uncharacterized protein YgiM (DUF1202 family)